MYWLQFQAPRWLLNVCVACGLIKGKGQYFVLFLRGGGGISDCNVWIPQWCALNTIKRGNGHIYNFFPFISKKVIMLQALLHYFHKVAVKRMNTVNSLRIQPSPIRTRYYVQKAKIDVCDSPPEIPYWWHKSVLNPDRSADWFTHQFCIISSTIIPCCDVQKSYGENLASPSLETFWLSVQSVCPMFNAGSMLYRLNKANFRLFIVLSAVRRFLSNYLPTGWGKPLIFQMALVHM